MQNRDDYRDSQEQKEETLETPGVLDKYKAAGDVANDVLNKVIAKCTAGTAVVDICAYGDQEITKAVEKIYNKKKIEKGIAFPTCISVNEICGHYSPLASEENKQVLQNGDVVKIDLGVHVDGYMGLVAHTLVVANEGEQVKDRRADVVLAAYNAVQAALRLLRPGNTNNQVTQTINTIAQSYKCNPLEGVLSHEIKKHVIDGNNVIISKETFEQKVDELEFQVNQAFALDVFVSTGEGKSKETELRTTVYKRAIEKTYNLKSKSARAFYTELNQKFPSLCFTMRAFEEEITAKIGVKECMEHDLLYPYPVLAEKQGEYVAQFKYTVLILGSQTLQVTGVPVNVEQYQTENQITDENIKQLLATATNKQAQKKQKKKKAEQQTTTTEEQKQ